MHDEDEDEVDIPYVSRRVWQKWDTDEWRTNFPPPADFAGTENGEWDEHNYWRTLTADEMVALIDAGLAACHHGVRHSLSLISPAGHGRRGTEFKIIWMGDDAECTRPRLIDGFEIRHAP